MIVEGIKGIAVISSMYMIAEAIRLWCGGQNMEKYNCDYCGDEFTPDDENDLYCCEACLDADIEDSQFEDDD